MELRDLWTLLVVLECGSFEAASRVLNITSAAVAHRISNLEDSVGQMLVVRGQPSRPTEVGETVARLARNLDDLHREAMGELGLLAKTHPLNVAVNFAALAAWFEAAIVNYQRSTGQTIHCSAIDERGTLEQLRSGGVEVALSPIERPISGCIVRPIGVLRYVAVVRPDLRDLARGGELPNLRFSRVDTTTDFFIQKMPLSSSDSVWVPSVEGLYQLCKQGCGWTVLPETIVKDDLDQHELSLLSSDLWMDLPIYFHTFRKTSDRIDTLLAACKQAAKGRLRPLGHRI